MAKILPGWRIASSPLLTRHLLRLLPLIVPLGLFLASSHPSAQESTPLVGKEVETAIASGENPRVIVFLDLPASVQQEDLSRLKEAVFRAQEPVLRALGAGDFTLGWRYEVIPSFSGIVTAPGLAKLERLPGVLRIEPDLPAHAYLTESVPLIRASQMHTLGHKGQGISVAILDTGIDLNHPDLSDDLIAQECWCSVSGGCCPNGTSRQSGAGAAGDANGHGTNVSGIVTSRGTVSPLGVAPDANIVAIRVLDAAGNGFNSDIIAGLNWVAANRPDVKVVNMSLGGGLFTGTCDTASPSFTSAVNTLRNQGVIVFAASGNDASGTQMGLPACIASVVSVGATYDANIGGISYQPPGACTDSTTFANKVTCFSNSNSTTDIFAPGAAITSCYLNGNTATYYGTSQATPHAAACAADLLSANSGLSPAQIETALKTSGVSVTDPKNNLSFPRIDCLGALASLGACIDLDGDGYGKPGSAQCPHGSATDCDDAHAAVYPGAPEICDGLNDNCSAPSWPTVPANEVDADGDGRPLCNDCNDNNSTIYPGAPQLCDGINNDCSAPGWPTVPANEFDNDGDGRRACNDCNDGNAAVYPGAPQLCGDGLNNDCSSPGWPALAGTNEADDDGDGFTECQGDCIDTASTIYPGAPQVCDGNNNNCSAPGWPSLAGTNEADDDGDGYNDCQGDCNDTKAAVFPGAPQICDGLNNNCSAPGWPSLAGTNDGDDDLDGYTECQGDCNDANLSVRPGGTQVCDGVNNNCSAPGWPSLAGTNEADDDADSQSECQSDCNDADATIFLGAVEINDGKDNQCPTNYGYGIKDEISGTLGFTNPANRNEVSWPAQSGASSYEVVRSGNPYPSGGPFLTSQLTSSTSWSDAGIPPVGSTYFYLARPTLGFVGSWGQQSNGQERQGLSNPETSCSDSLDNDGDSLTDCSDPDCYAAANCAAATFTFTDTLGNDIANDALSSFFTPLTVSSSDYLLISLTGPGIADYSICAQHADFYRSNYLSLAVTGGTAMSGSWSRWTLQEGGSWTGPDASSYENRFGPDCLGGHSWCPESTLAGRDIAILPEETAECETLDFSVGCGAGAWQLTVKVGHSRLSTCGF